MSPDPQMHVHRIGRTGRVDEQGLALSLASLDDASMRKAPARSS